MGSNWIDGNYLVFRSNMWDRASMKRGFWDGLLDYGNRLERQHVVLLIWNFPEQEGRLLNRFGKVCVIFIK